MAPRIPARGQLEGAVLLAVGAALLMAFGSTALGVIHWADVFWLLRNWGIATGFLAIAVSCVIAGWRGLVRASSTSYQRSPLQPIRWWAIGAAVAVVLAATWVSITWLLQAAAPTDPANRLDAIRTGLAIGAGTGAAIALLFTARRQWLSERTQVHTELDATERRVTDMYAKAVEQFGTDQNLVVRLAGLHALDRLAQLYPDYRRTIVDVLCAYLRNPYPGNSSGGPGLRRSQHRVAAASTPRRDLPVQLAAQTVLVDHLRPDTDRRGEPTNPKFWPDTDLNLAGATVTDLNLSECQVRSAHFAGTRFIGNTTFRDSRFTDIDLSTAHFGGGALFRNAQFDGVAEFDGTRFEGEVLFNAAQFDGLTRFRNVRFNGGVQFFGTAAKVDVEFHETLINGISYTGWARSDDTGLRLPNQSSAPQPDTITPPN